MSSDRNDASGSSALSSLECWDYSIELECLQGPEDLQLAAELGKTLLERNKELETSLKQHQNVIEDQTQEIEYLTKQTAALREVNDSRLRIYEQLEVSIQDLERANQRLSLDNSADKKHIKSLCVSIDTLETRCEELQRSLDEASLQQDSYRRRQQRLSVCSTPGTPTVNGPVIGACVTTPAAEDEAKELSDDEEVIGLLTQLQELRSQKTKEQRKVSELEEQLSNVLQDNLALEEQLTVLRQKEEDMKSLQEEMSTLEEVRQGHLCGRCLRHVDSRNQDELSLLMDHEEEDDVSVVNSIVSETHRSTAMIQIEGTEINRPYDNPYRILVEKYEALVQMQRPVDSKRHSMVNSVSQTNCLSLQEELQMSGDFNSFNAKDIEEQDEDAVVPEKEMSNKMTERSRGPAAKTFSMTPTDFSEAETSSSGFSDETSNKGTQTEIIAPAGSFLCSIADGNDCRFSIYDDANPVESRFRKKPQYRQLFREIFDVLKRAAENKDEGEQLPLLDDLIPVTDAPKVPPATPAREDVPTSFSKDVAPPDQVVANTSDKPLSLPNGTNLPLTAESINSDKQMPITSALELEAPKTVQPPAPKQDILEYLSIGVGIKKKSNGRKNSPMKTLKTSVAERVEHLEARPATSNKAGNGGSGRRRRYMDRVNDSPSSSRPESPGTFGVWYNKEATAPSSPPGTSSPQQQQQPNWDFKPYLSTASQEVAKLKRLEKSYAEVLRLGPQPSHRPKTINGYRRH